MKYIQIHELISYPASNLNRDDMGRPKTVNIGDSVRIRVSSQSLKRAWRNSDQMREGIDEIGVRSNKLSDYIASGLKNGRTLFDEINSKGETTREPVNKEDADLWGEYLYDCLASKENPKNFDEFKKKAEKSKDKKPAKKQLIHFCPKELEAVDKIMEEVSEGKEVTETNIRVEGPPFPFDVAMSGRMVADAKLSNCEAAVQVAHGYTVQKAAIEDDFFTAVDDLSSDDNSGAGHVNDAYFGAGLFYIYICIDYELLVKNLGSEETAKKVLANFMKTVSTVTPTGKQNSYASRAYASYLMVEKGDKQPRSLSSAFFEPIGGGDVLNKSIKQLEDVQTKINNAFGKCYDDSYTVNVEAGVGNMDDLIKFLG